MSPGWPGYSAEARFLASFLAALSKRRSRSLLSRVSFAMVVFFLPREAMLVRPLLWSSERPGRTPVGGEAASAGSTPGFADRCRSCCRAGDAVAPGDPKA